MKPLPLATPRAENASSFSSTSSTSSPQRRRQRQYTTYRTAAAASSRFLLLLPLLAQAPTVASAMLNCDKVQVDGAQFDLSPLKGPHAVVTSIHYPGRFKNATFTLDICGPLKRHDGKEGAECPENTWVCGIWHLIDTEKQKEILGDVKPIAGELDGRSLDPVVTRLSPSENDRDKVNVGVRLSLQGGMYENRAQKAVIDFVCNSTLEGTEGEWKHPAASRSSSSRSSKRDDNVPQQLKNEGAALIYDSYEPSKKDPNTDVLKLTWYTKHVCERSQDGGKDEESKHWGFFTWMVILVFLATAAYLIFGSWLNYTRYGARGWDLLPHGDAIRDIPYLLQDWIRRLINTMQGSGSRGGYSAV